MSHNLDMTNSRANIAFLGSRNDIWHRMGQEMLVGQGIEEWANAAGLGWKAIKVPAIAALEGPAFDHIEASKRFLPVADRAFVVRSDNGAPLGFVSGENEGAGYQIVQPADVLAWFERYISVDDRFQLDVAGSLDGGKRIWATARYNGAIDVAGEEHSARVLMSTSFDGTAATINQCTMTRVVCQNTLRLAHGDKRAAIKTRHSTRFDAGAVGRELGQLASAFAQFKAVGDALGQVEFAKDATADFFKDVLDIPRNAKRDDVSTRKLNQYQELSGALRTSIQEGAKPNSAWAALQAITRYADHERSVRANGGDVDVARFEAAQFGTGDAIKGKALNLLMPLIADRVPVAA